jgi:hypothetical protein
MFYDLGLLRLKTSLDDIKATERAKRRRVEQVGFEQFCSFSTVLLFGEEVIKKSCLRKGWLRSWVQILPPGPLFLL